MFLDCLRSVWALPLVPRLSTIGGGLHVAASASEWFQSLSESGVGFPACPLRRQLVGPTPVDSISSIANHAGDGPPQRSEKKPMHLTQIPFGITDWSRIPSERKNGETGWADWKVCQFGDVRVRMLQYHGARSSVDDDVAVAGAQRICICLCRSSSQSPSRRDRSRTETGVQSHIPVAGIFPMSKNYSLTYMKKGASARLTVVTGVTYLEIQKRLATEIAIHVNNNPVSQEIAEVVIRWKAPSDREYIYAVNSS